MIGAKFWGVSAACTAVVGAANQIAMVDGTAVAFYVAAVGMAMLAIYSKWREEKRKQDAADREARRGDCEEELKAVRGDVAELEKKNGDLAQELDRWKALLDSSRSGPKPGRKTDGPRDQNRS